MGNCNYHSDLNRRNEILLNRNLRTNLRKDNKITQRYFVPHIPKIPNENAEKNNINKIVITRYKNQIDCIDESDELEEKKKKMLRTINFPGIEKPKVRSVFKNMNECKHDKSENVSSRLDFDFEEGLDPLSKNSNFFNNYFNRFSAGSSVKVDKCETFTISDDCFSNGNQDHKKLRCDYSLLGKEINKGTFLLIVIRQKEKKTFQIYFGKWRGVISCEAPENAKGIKLKNVMASVCYRRPFDILKKYKNKKGKSLLNFVIEFGRVVSNVDTIIKRQFCRQLLFILDCK